VEQRGAAEHHVAGRQAHPLAERAGVEDHVAVGVHRAFRLTSRARGIGEHGYVIRAEGDRLRPLAAVLAQQFAEVGRARRRQPRDARQHGRDRVVVQVVKRAGRDRHRDPGTRGRPGRDRVPQVLQADDGLRAGVGEDVAQLAFLEHRVDRDRDRTELPGGEQGNHELRDVLQEQRQPVAPAQAARGQRGGQGIAVRLHAPARHRSAEVVEERPGRRLRGPGAAMPHGQRVAVAGRDVGRLAGLVQPEPRPLLVITHPSTPTPGPGPRSSTSPIPTDSIFTNAHAWTRRVGYESARSYS
jgi:hypothetical protein